MAAFYASTVQPPSNKRKAMKMEATMIANILIFLKWKTAYQVSQEIHNSKSNYSGVIKLASIYQILQCFHSQITIALPQYLTEERKSLTQIIWKEGQCTTIQLLAKWLTCIKRATPKRCEFSDSPRHQWIAFTVHLNQSHQ